MRNSRTITPIETVNRCESVATPSAERAQCNACGKTFAGGAIVAHSMTEPDYYRSFPACLSSVKRHRERAVTLAEDARVKVAQRSLYCDHCDHVQVWFEAVDAGEFTGCPLPPEAITLESVTHVWRFLQLYPQAKGVEQQ